MRLAQSFHHRGVERLAGCEVLVRETRYWHARPGCALQGLHSGSIGDDHADRGIQTALRHGVENGLRPVGGDDEAIARGQIGVTHVDVRLGDLLKDARGSAWLVSYGDERYVLLLHDTESGIV